MLFPRVKNFVFCRQGELKEWQDTSLWGLGVKRGTKINSGSGSHQQHHHYEKWRQKAFSSLWRGARYVLEAVAACLGSCRCHMEVIQSGDCGVPTPEKRHSGAIGLWVLWVFWLSMYPAPFSSVWSQHIKKMLIIWWGSRAWLQSPQVRQKLPVGEGLSKLHLLTVKKKR